MSAVMPRVLAVEGDPTVRNFLAISLANASFEVETVASAREALKATKKSMPDAMLIGEILPDITGLKLARRLRENQKTSSLPILMLVSSDFDVENNALGEIDIDDFICKPVNPKELASRIRALLRRTAPQHGREVIAFGGVVIDSSEVSVTVDGTECHLRPIEFKLMRLLLSQPRRVFSRRQLLDLVWGNSNFISARTVDVTMRRLRQAIGPRGYDLIRTMRGAGYVLSNQYDT